MAIPAYAKARIDYLLMRYSAIPSIVYFNSRRESAPPQYRATKRASIFFNEVTDIKISYFCKPKSKPQRIRSPLSKSKKDAIAWALKQVEEGI